MKKEYIKINSIPAIIWGEPSHEVYVFVHGRYSDKNAARGVAEIADRKGLQVISFDLPEHGDRKEVDETEFIIQNCIPELHTVIQYVENRWKEKYLFASSIGAYFSLVAFQETEFHKSLFISPVVDMEELIHNMMHWFGVDIKRLEEEKTIDTPMGEKLSWEYLQYVNANRIAHWDNEIKIIIGDDDELTNADTLHSLSRKHRCEISLIPGGKHYLSDEKHQNLIGKWMTENI